MADWIAVCFAMFWIGFVSGRARRRADRTAAWRDGWAAKDEQLRALERLVTAPACPFWACDLDEGHDGDHLLDLAGRHDLPWPLL